VPDLVAPTTELHAAWLEAHREWGPGQHEDGFGLGLDDDVDTPDGFAAWVARMRVAPGSSLWWIVEGDTVLGGIALRNPTNGEVPQHGHVGYGIRPSARGRGLATWALREILSRAAGLDRVLICCEAGNVASASVIERVGGVLEDVRETPVGRMRRYWVDLTDRASQPGTSADRA